MMKRGREDDSLEVAKCLIQISNGWRSRELSGDGARMFQCKTCGRAFSSFQALGGHRASHHKKPRLSTGEEKIPEALVKTIHECSICGIKFGLGQALGGHMRRHRVELKGNLVDDHRAVSHHQAAPVLMRLLSKNKRIMSMDLNLTPLENDLQVLFGNKAPKVDCKLV